MSTTDVDIAIVGLGMSGIKMVQECQNRGYSFIVLESADSPGGTWRDHNYPGLFVDIPASEFQFQWAPKPDWRSAFASGPEINQYLQAVAAGLQAQNHTRYNCRIVSAKWSETHWRILADDGSVVIAQALVFATGFLRVPRVPAIRGMDDFAGRIFHSSRWPQDLNLTGKRVGIVGSGSSGIQLVTALGLDSIEVTHFVRSPQWIHVIRNTFATENELAAARESLDYAAALRSRLEEQIWTRDCLRNDDWKYDEGALREEGQDALRSYLNDISDPELRRNLTPDFPPGCKRIPKSVDYFNVVQRDNVHIERGSVEGLSASGILGRSGSDSVPLDVVVLATGYDSHAYMLPLEVSGVHGQTLDEVWGAEPFAYLGMMVPGFPNMFLLNGPFSPVNLLSIPPSLEYQCAFLFAVLDMALSGFIHVSPTETATRRFIDSVRAQVGTTVWGHGCQNWYQAVPDGVPILWPWKEESYASALGNIDTRDFVGLGAAHHESSQT